MLARLRQARHIKQADAAVRAGLSRNTAYRIEKGDPGLAFGQMLEYLIHGGRRAYRRRPACSGQPRADLRQPPRQPVPRPSCAAAGSTIVSLELRDLGHGGRRVTRYPLRFVN
ncbi:helix-turn-helix transcriptional regulator (plasmid) [Cupriavidus sp. KK10]|nr:helix-turn-helix transcriptional regulator [Cupriavidus sp. KK10]